MGPPLPARISADDDFIHTISDSDADIPDEEDVLPPAAGTKRKREDGGRRSLKGDRTSLKRPKSKRQKKDNDEVDGGDTAVINGEEEEGEDADMTSDFEFVVGDGKSTVLEDFDGWEPNEAGGNSSDGPAKGVNIDDIIERRRKQKDSLDSEMEDGTATEGFSGSHDGSEGTGDEDEFLAEDGFGMGVKGDDEDGEESERGESNDGASRDGNVDDGDDSGDDSVASPVPHPMDVGSDGEDEGDDSEDTEEAERRAEFFAPEEALDEIKTARNSRIGSFQSMSLSRPILKGLASVNFTQPTPIQAKTIPVALLGKDVVGGAVTGSGKTAAFMIPILERLLYRPKKIPTTRVAVLMPTRELAVQCFNVSKKLAQFTDITFAQIVGGFSLREQEAVLKTRPDVVIATPGRFIDHVRNSPSFAVDALEILVLDEADRMLEDGFADELDEILKAIPKSRQTMLFSATMTSSVDRLVRAGLSRPVRLMVDAKKQTVSGLVQEFVRLRQGGEDRRFAALMYLCERVYTDRAIVFFRQKKEAHRARVIFGLCGLKAAELHGGMSQEQRIRAVEAFRAGAATHLLATDLAARGLDISAVAAVLNHSAPQSLDIYLHRVGRTARAGRAGRACTLAAESDRKVVRLAVKVARAQGARVAARALPAEEVEAWVERLEGLQAELEAVLEEEKAERMVAGAERDVRRGENLVRFEAEIKSRPRRTWFESEAEKRKAKEAGGRELNGEVARAAARKKKKLSGKERKRLEDRDTRAGGGRVWKKKKADGAVTKEPKRKAGKADSAKGLGRRKAGKAPRGRKR